MNKQDPGKKVFEMLSFQYKPLEKILKSEFQDLYKIYKSCNYAKKIKMLDLLAQHLGL